MKVFYRIIAVILLIVTIFCCFSVPIYASYEGSFYSSSNFWTWASSKSIWLKDILEYRGLFSFTGNQSVCPDSSDSLHHSTIATPVRFSGGDIVMSCHCDNCGALFEIKIPYEDYISYCKESYDYYVGNTDTPPTPTTGGQSGGTWGGRDRLRDVLGTTIVSSSGYILPIPVKGFLTLNGSGFKLDSLISVESSSYGGLDNSIVFLSGTPIIGLWLDTDSLPVSPSDAHYTFVAEYSTSNFDIGVYYNLGIDHDKNLQYEKLTSPVAVAKGAAIPFGKFFESKSGYYYSFAMEHIDKDDFAGSETKTCSKCGETKTTQLPALGHKWKVLRTVQTKYDESGELIQEGYTLYECERCGEQYKQDLCFKFGVIL